MKSKKNTILFANCTSGLRYLMKELKQDNHFQYSMEPIMSYKFLKIPRIKKSVKNADIILIEELALGRLYDWPEYEKYGRYEDSKKVEKTLNYLREITSKKKPYVTFISHDFRDKDLKNKFPEIDDVHQADNLLLDFLKNRKNDQKFSDRNRR